MRIEPFAVTFWAPGIVLIHILKQLTQPAGLTSLNIGTGTILYGMGLNWLKTIRLPAFSDLAILFIYAPSTQAGLHKRSSLYMFLIYGSDGVKQIFHIIFWLRMRRMERVPGTWTACCRLHLCTWRLMKGSCQLSTFYSSIPIIRWISIFYSVVS